MTEPEAVEKIRQAMEAGGWPYGDPAHWARQAIVDGMLTVEDVEEAPDDIMVKIFTRMSALVAQVVAGWARD